MNYKELVEAIEKSSQGDWSIINEGPMPQSYGDISHARAAVYKPNVAISIAWGYPAEGEYRGFLDMEDRQYKDVSAVYLDYFYEGRLFSRKKLVSFNFNGTGMYLPYIDKKAGYADFYDADIKFMKVFNALCGVKRTDFLANHFETAGLIQRPDLDTAL